LDESTGITLDIEDFPIVAFALALAFYYVPEGTRPSKKQLPGVNTREDCRASKNDHK
jgi:hypothetical protein